MPCLRGLQSIYVRQRKKYSGSTLPKNKAVSRRQYIQHGKARSTQQRSIWAKEAAITEMALGDPLSTRVSAGRVGRRIDAQRVFTFVG